MKIVALISELVTELSVMSGIPERSIAVVARHLREAGLLSQKGRGRGAAHASPLDAARLCIALMVGGKAKDAPGVVADFGRLRARIARSEPGHPFSVFNLEEFGLGDGHPFEEGLAALIDAWSRKDFVEKMGEMSRLYAFLVPMTTASLHDHSVTGSIFIGKTHYSYEHHALQAVLHPEQTTNIRASSAEQSGLLEEYVSVSRKYASGIRSTREISAAEIRPLGEVIAGLRPAGFRASNERLAVPTDEAMEAIGEEDSERKKMS